MYSWLSKSKLHQWQKKTFSQYRITLYSPLSCSILLHIAIQHCRGYTGRTPLGSEWILFGLQMCTHADFAVRLFITARPVYILLNAEHNASMYMAHVYWCHRFLFIYPCCCITKTNCLTCTRSITGKHYGVISLWNNALNAELRDGINSWIMDHSSITAPEVMAFKIHQSLSIFE